MQKDNLPLYQAVFLLLFFLMSFTTTSLFGQCGCTFTIPPGPAGVTFDGNAKGVKPGDVICLQAGSLERVLFMNIKGSPEKPIIIKNCGGQVLLGGPNANSGLVFWSSRYFRITGAGDPSKQYGIKITQTKPGTSGIVVTSLSSDVEIDHVEITKTGFAGIMAKTDPTSDCSNTTMVRPNFTMYNIKLHNNYVHHIGGEGFYVGNSFYSGTTVYCGSTQYPHEVRGVRIYNNLFDACGWESIQVGSAVQDVEVYNNKIYNYGAADIISQNGGIQFGLGTSGRLYNNFIKGNPNGTGGQAIVIQGIGNNYVYNNVIVNSPDESITINTKPTPLATDIVNKGWLGGTYIINNTIVNPGKAAVADFVNQAPGNVFYNNLIITGADPIWNKTKPYYDWKVTNNIVLNSIAAAKFVNPGLDDYNLQSSSPAINVGRDVASFGVTKDFQGRGRPTGASWDVGAFELAGSSNQKPNVILGANRTITLPTNSGTVTATASDPDGSIVSYRWLKKSGPAATLTNTTTPTLTIAAMVEGAYVFGVTVTDNGGETAYAEMTFTVAPSAINQPPVSNGLTYKYYEGTWSVLPNFNTLTPVKIGNSPNVDLSPRVRDTNIAFYWEGTINIPVAGNYTFETYSDDGSKLYIGGYSESNLIVNNDGGHGSQYREGTKNFAAPGSYPIVITYFQGGGRFRMSVYWKNTANGVTARQLIPNTAFMMSGTARGGAARMAMEGLVLSEEDEITTQVYPNPFTNKLSVKLSTPVSGVTRVQLVNALGVEVYSDMIIQDQLSEIELQLSDGLANGMYLLKVDNGGMLINRRLIRQ